MTEICRVLVIGGGIGGMSMAISLRQIGIGVDLIDKDPQWRALGAGLTVTGPTLRAFEKIGILPRIKIEGFCSDGVNICDANGAVLQEIATPELGAGIPGMGGILRPVLHRILSESTLARGINVRLGVSAETIEQDESSVTVIFSDGSTQNYDLVIVADGVASSIRKQIFPESAQPAFTGQGSWRAVVKRPSTITRMHVCIAGDMKVGVNPVSGAEMYLYLLENLPDNPWIAPETYLEKLKALLGGFGGFMEKVREALTPQSNIIYRPLEALILPSPWYVGRILLVGDAAHATTPHLASGAGMAVEDAIVLSEILGVRDLSVSEILSRFMERRYARCKMIVENSLRLGEIEMNRGSSTEHNALQHKSLQMLAAQI